MRRYGRRLFAWDELPRADAIVAAVSHRGAPRSCGVEDIQRKLIKGGCFIDVKAVFDRQALEQAGIPGVV